VSARRLRTHCAVKRRLNFPFFKEQRASLVKVKGDGKVEARERAPGVKSSRGLPRGVPPADWLAPPARTAQCRRLFRQGADMTQSEIIGHGLVAALQPALVMLPSPLEGRGAFPPPPLRGAVRPVPVADAPCNALPARLRSRGRGRLEWFPLSLVGPRQAPPSAVWSTQRRPKVRELSCVMPPGISLRERLHQ